MIVIRLWTDNDEGEADGDDVEILLLFAQAHETLVKHSGNALGFSAGNSCMYEVAPTDMGKGVKLADWRFCDLGSWNCANIYNFKFQVLFTLLLLSPFSRSMLSAGVRRCGRETTFV